MCGHLALSISCSCISDAHLKAAASCQLATTSFRTPPFLIARRLLTTCVFAIFWLQLMDATAATAILPLGVLLATIYKAIYEQ
jgi:hypothetical protein